MKTIKDLEVSGDTNILSYGFKIILIIFVFSAGIATIGGMLGLFSETAQVAKEEFGARGSLRKYEWFKDASAEIEKLDADIQIYQNKQNWMCQGKLDRLAREQCMTWGQEVAGIKSAYNGLVAEYNAASSKFNWSFYNMEGIPTQYKRK